MLPLFASIRLVYWIGAIGVLIWNYRNLGDMNLRRRMRLFVTGVCLCLLFNLIQAFGSIRIWDFQKPIIALYWSTPLPLAVSMALAIAGIMMAVAIVKHRLFGFRMMIRRSLQYAAARGLLLGLAPFCLAVFVGDLLLHADQPLGAILVSRGWFYAVLGIGGALAHLKRKAWQDALDRRFFRERYNAQQMLAGVVQEIGRATTLEDVAPRVVAQVEAALHPSFAALVRRGVGESAFFVLAEAGQESQPGQQAQEAPDRTALQRAPMPAAGKLATLIRVLEKPVEIIDSGSNWLWRQLPPQETAWLRQVRIEWLFPVNVSSTGPELLLVLGPKRSEEPYSQEDQNLLEAVTAALALRSGSPGAIAPPPVAWATD
jgi:sigma-B regulation protein RsbU (phosphoserine phosphatase)